MMKINCISCGHKVDLGDAYEDYEGPVKCYVCGALLAIKTEEGSLKSMGLIHNQPPTVTDNVTPPL
jgi:DNA-directed RNA polymerase subunit N (RpoN/RPB10)